MNSHQPAPLLVDPDVAIRAIEGLGDRLYEGLAFMGVADEHRRSGGTTGWRGGRLLGCGLGIAYHFRTESSSFVRWFATRLPSEGERSTATRIRLRSESSKAGTEPIRPLGILL